MALCMPARTSLLSFLLGNVCFLISNCFSLTRRTQNVWENWWIVIFIVCVVLVNVCLRLFYTSKDAYEVAVRGGFLGCACSLGLIISFNTSTYTHFGWYLFCLSIFHWSEYFTTAVTNPRSLTLESYLLDHSKEYKVAALASWTEFCIEYLLFPGMKQFRYISMIGVILTLVGEVVRKASMITASTNFNHYVQYVKRRDHELVTHGIYSLCRHPSYVGWFLWSIGTQVILCNPICLVGYTVVSWRFFRGRIWEEEMSLISFFGEDYIDYKKRVGTGLPFIYGFQPLR